MWRTVYTAQGIECSRSVVLYYADQQALLNPINSLIITNLKFKGALNYAL